MLVIHLFFAILLLEKCFLCVFLSLFDTASHDDIIEECSCLDLPDFESNVCTSVFTNFVHIFIIFVFWILNHWVFPFTFVFWVVYHRRLPFTVIFVVPVFWLLSIWIGNFFWLIVPVIWLFVIGIDNFGFVDPIIRLFCVRILDHLFRQKVKMLVKGTPM